MTRTHSSFLRHFRRWTVGAAALALALPATSAASQIPTSIELQGTIRDFSPTTHPDFESAIGDDRNMVQTTLGTDGKPVYAYAVGSSWTTHGKAAFDQWFNDTPGVNVSAPLSLTAGLVPGSEPPTYRYANTDFFPIDGQLFGNEGYGHNYHFTYEIHNRFTYQGGEVFRFTGDDDVWVFIDGRRVVDLGGVHGPESASVALDGLGLTRGQDYDFDMFFAERHTVGSNFLMETTLQLAPPDTDADDDGVEDNADNCPAVANPGQADADGDQVGDACDEHTDSDGDGVADSSDNCPAVANADQDDLDGDGSGDACDADDDGDSVGDVSDNCARTANADQADVDGDRIGDACDPQDDRGQPCKVTDGGWIVVDGARANFGGNAQPSQKGQQVYEAKQFGFKAGSVASVRCSADLRSATIEGQGTVDRSTPVTYRIDVRDLGEPGTGDTYRIRLSDGYDSGERTLSGGNIQIHG